MLKTNIDLLQNQLDETRRKLSNTEQWEYIDDIPSLGFQSPKFALYRMSAAYRALKYLRHEFDNNSCVKCGCKNKLHLHHLSYKRLFQELLTDVVTLCSTCHNEGHEAKNQTFNLKNKEKKMKTNYGTFNYVSEQTMFNFLKYSRYYSKYMEFFQKAILSGVDPVNEADKLTGQHFGLSAKCVQNMRKQSGFVKQVRENSSVEKLCSPNALYTQAVKSNDYSAFIEGTIKEINAEAESLLNQQKIKQTLKPEIQTVRPAENAKKVKPVLAANEVTEVKPEVKDLATLMQFVKSVGGRVTVSLKDPSKVEIKFD